MGQILRRISRITKTYLSEERSAIPHDLPDPDYELKKEFEKLKETKSSNHENSETVKNNSVMNKALAYSILEIPTNSSKEQIKSAYIKKIKEYHPDKVASMGTELRLLAEKKTKEINEAYSFLNRI
ncbi:MAG: J domain-containing protein [Candidatus Kapabacteria bacterium]|nr:J domain-containing protein [Candidatus Kapabacteria bacterium]